MQNEPVGFTTSIPVEILLAAGRTPVDLNNIFIEDPDPCSRVEEAEERGFPRNTCGWIKGIYSAARKEGLEEVIAVTQGDCSNTHALMEIFEEEGIRIFPFAYPYDRDPDLLRLQMEKTAGHFGTTLEAAESVRKKLLSLRGKIRKIDRETWEGNRVTGQENHYYQVCASDFRGDPVTYESELDRFLAEVAQRKPFPDGPRIGFIGVPPIINGLYEAIEEMGGRVVYNEVQRQFAMPFEAADLVEQYLIYTYPYSIYGRLEDVQGQIRQRKIHGIIHYAQAFCFRQIEDILFRKRLEVPVLTLEGDKPGGLDQRTRIRLEAFVEMLNG
ncbi:MAG: 2-hydroxyacyl-CoA dehydratase [Deltaproteobacteria bacterium]|nr:2-hydroxyacyl-CoA dehydratase [Deltaproteobacteria bacterium]